MSNQSPVEAPQATHAAPVRYPTAGLPRGGSVPFADFEMGCGSRRQSVAGRAARSSRVLAESIGPHRPDGARESKRMVSKRQRWEIGLLVALLTASELVSLLRMVVHPNWSLFVTSMAVAWMVAALLFRMIVERP